MNSLKLINRLCENDGACDTVTMRVKRIFPGHRVAPGPDSAWVTFLSGGSIECHMKVWPLNGRVNLMTVDRAGSLNTGAYFQPITAGSGSGVFYQIPDTDEAIRQAGDEIIAKIAASKWEKEGIADEIRSTLGEAQARSRTYRKYSVRWLDVRHKIKVAVDALAADQTREEIDVDVDIPEINKFGIKVRLGSFVLPSRRGRFVFPTVSLGARQVTSSSWQAMRSHDFSYIVVDLIKDLMRLIDKDAEEKSEFADELKSLE
jgi:hypothetical protein